MDDDEDEILVSDQEFRDWCPPHILKELADAKKVLELNQTGQSND